LTGFRCLVVDRPGTGLSEFYEVTADNIAEFGSRFVGDLLDGLGLDSAHLVVSSFGGHLALRSAASEPDRVLRMVQMAAPAAGPGQTLPPFMKLMTSGFVRKVLGVLPPSRKASENILRQIGHGVSLDQGKIADVFWDWYLALGRYTDTMKNDGEIIGRHFVPNVERIALSNELLGSVSTPTLYLWGKDDGFGGEDAARLTVGPMPNAELVMIPDAGHLPWLDEPEMIARDTGEFLSDTTDRSDQSKSTVQTGR
jgi:pimeloyl-ACP methyl ester carboxylesterase